MKLRNIIIITTLYTPYIIHSSEISIKTAQKKDIPAILALDKKVINEFFKPTMMQGYPNSFDNNPELVDTFCNEWNKYLNELLSKVTDDKSNNNYILLASDTKKSDKIIGLCIFNIENKKMFIDYLIVSQKSRGKGIGKALLDDALASHKDMETCALDTLAHNNNATQQFYERYGFTSTKEPITLMESIQNTHIRYTLQLKK